MLLLTSHQVFAADPIAHDDQFSAGSGQQVSGLLSSNDEFLDGPSDSYAILTNPTNGVASVSTDGNFSYSPNIGFAGTDTFTYAIDDGAGGTSSALVNVSVAAASNFLSSASPILFTPEDTQVPLGLSVAQDLFDGGALQDLIATDALFRSDSAGATPVLSSIPAGTSSVTITGYSTQSLNTSGDDLIDDDYQLLNVRIDLVSGTSSGRVAFINHGQLSNLDQYSWEKVPLGQAVLNDPSKVTGFYASGDSNPTFSVVAGSLQIVETHPLETAYIVEYLTSDGDSTNFLGAGNTVQIAGESSSTLSFPAALEPAATKHGIIALNATSAAAGTNFQVEHKGFARLLIDLNTHSVSGSIAAQRGENVNNTVTYSFKNYPLIDKRISSATPVSILASSASIVGDITADASVVQDPTLYIDSSGQLTIERASGFAAVFTSIYTAEYYERTGFSSIASTVSIGSADALFDSSPADGVDEFGDPVNEFVFAVPASAHVGLLQMSWNTIGGNDTNENIGLGFAVVDLESGVSSGSMTFIRASTPDLLSWDGVPFGSTFFGTNNGSGDPLYQSNKTAGSFTDPFVQTAKFLLTSNPDGSRELTFTATSTGGTQNFRDYRGNANISWLGNEPFSISGVPTQGLLSHGSPNDAGGWEIDFSDIPALAYQPAPHESGTIPLSFGLSSTGEIENIELRIAPIADSPSLSSSDVVGFIDNAIVINVVVADSADTDDSETHPTNVTFGNVPSSITFSATTGTVSDLGSGNWLVDRASLATLTANATSTLDTTISVSVLQIDEKDVDSDLVIEDNDNGNGVDEFDELQVSDSFSLRVQTLPTVTSLLVNNGVPVISGTASSAAGETLTVTVNNIVYPQSGPDLIVNGDGTWTLTIPAANTLPENTYTVTAQITHSSGNLGSDTTDDELVVDLTPPPAPGVTSQTTMDNTPTITGTLAIASGNTLSVSVNSVPYTEGNGQLVDNGDGTWELQIPAINFLPDALYQVIATLTDAAGNTSTDASVDELLIDTLAPPSPGVTSQTTNDITPVIEGTAILATGDMLSVEVNNIPYTVGDGNLVDNGDGTWTLSIPVANVLSEAVYDVSATVTDVALNVGTDPSSSELTIDLTAPASPTVTALLTNQTTPTLMGTASVGGGETLSVSVDGMVYTEGDGNLINNGDSTWTLTIPTNKALSEGTLEVTATVTDAAGNSSSDSSNTELEVDLTTPPVPTVVSQLTASATPTITGTATIAAGDTLSVDVNGVVYLTGNGNLLDNGNGTWSLPIPTGNALPDGSYEVLVSISDAAGNVALDVSSTELVVDLTPPPAPGVTSQTTSDSTPLISGITSIMSGATLRVEVNNVVYLAGDGNLVDNLDGTWDLIIPSGNTLSDALYQVIATLTDAAGNISTDAGIDELLVDTMAPPSPGVTSLTTNDTTPLIMGTAIVVAGETLTVTLNTELYTAGDGNLTDNNDGTWTLIVPSGNSLLDGAYDVTATVTDAALNTSTDPSSSELLIDTLAPASPTVTSQVTNTTTPTITGTATVLVGESLLVAVNGMNYTVGDGALLDNADGTWTLVIPVGDELPEALFDVSVTVTDGAGNSASDASVDELDIDLTPPAVPTVASLLTNNVSPTLTGTASLTPVDILSVSVNNQIYVVGGGSLSTSGGNWTLIIPNANALIEATWDVLATISDAAGNISSDNSTSELIIDLTPPPAPGVTSQTTNDDTPLIEGTTTIGSGMTLSVEVDGEPYVEGDGNLINNGDGTWALTIPMVNALGDALYQVIASLTDAAGNVSTETGVDELLVDTMAPTSPGVTSQTINTGTPVIAGTATVGTNEILTVTVNSVTYTAGDGNLVDNTDGTWTLTIPASNTLAEASYDVTAIVTDVAMNTSTDPSSSELTIDLTAPAAPTINAQLTNSTTPTLSGTATVAVGETLSVTVNNVTYVAGDGDLVDNGDGTWTLVVPTGNALPEGLLSVSAIVTDAAGNSASNASTDDLQIDLTPPAVPTVNTQLTNSETPTLSGTATLATGETLSVTVNSVTYVAGNGNLVDNGNGTWTLVIPTGNELPEASIDVLVSVLDAAGNSSSDISTDELTVDLTPPPAPGVTSQTTNDDTPLIEGTTTIGSGMTLSVEVDGEPYVEGDGNLINNGDGTWALTIPMVDALGDALYQVIASLTDAAGNVSTETGVDELLVDTMAPTSPGVTSQTINTGTPVIAGTATVGTNEILTVTVNSVTYTAGDNNLVDNTDGTWTLTIPATNTLAEASYDVTAIVTDVALNTSTDPSSSELTIDLTAPVAPTVNALETNVTTPVVSGSAIVQTGETLRVTVNNVPYVANDGYLVDNSDGTWSLSIPVTAALTEADYDVLVTVTDAAGNSTSDASVDELKIDLTAASAPMVSITSDVDNNGMLSSAELADPVEVLVSLPASANVGDSVLISDGSSPTTVILTSANLTAGNIAISYARPVEGASLTVIATHTDRAGNSSAAGTDNAVVDTIPTLAPVVSIIEDTDNNALIGSGELAGDINVRIFLPSGVSAGDTLLFTIDGSDVAFVLGPVNIAAGIVNIVSALSSDGDTVNVTASITDSAGNASLSANDSAVLDLTPPPLPTINTLVSNTGTPILSGFASLTTDYTLTVALNGQVYTNGDGSLVINGDGSWTLSIQAIAALSDGVYEVVTTLTDLAGNTTADSTNNELTIDLTAPVVPTVNTQLINSATPTLTGTATITTGETLSVTVNGVIYIAGDGNLVDNGDGTWTLVIPSGNELPQGVIDVSVIVTDEAGNSSTDVNTGELEIDLTPPIVPTFNTQLTNSPTPTLSGTATVSAGETLSVTVNGVTYVAGDSHLVDNGDGTWTLDIPSGNALPEGSIAVTTTVTDAAGNSSSVNSTSELIIDLTPPPAPGVTSQTTNDDTPLIEGTTTIGSGMTLRVEVNGELYVEGDSNLVNNGDGTWALTIPVINALGDALYQVIASLTDAAGNVGTEAGVDELLVDTMAPTSPGVTSQTINTGTPVIVGTATVDANETLTVTVNSVIYTAGDGNLVDNTDGTWTLTIPASNTLAEASYNVTAIVTDVAMNTSTDPSSSELTIDLTAPAAPTVNAHLTNSTTPTLSGTANVAVGETLSVTVNNVTYVAGDGNLVDNGDGTWTLIIPTGNELPQGVIDVSVTVTDAAGNSTSDSVTDDLEIDLTPPVVPTVNAQLTNSSTPTLSGTATLTAGETLSVTVNGVTYVVGDGNLIDNGDGTWTLAIPTGNELSQGVIDVSVTVKDAAGNSTSDSVTDELEIDLTPPVVPTVNAQLTNSETPTLNGTATLATGETLSVTVNGVTYVAGDGNLVDNGDGTWTLVIPTGNELPEGTLSVSVIITDAAGNSSSNASTDDLQVDLTPPVAPTVNAQLTNSATPALSGTATLAAGETLSVTVNGVTYVAGDGILVDNGDGTWVLVVPAGNELPEGTLSVGVIITDAAGNSSSNASTDDLQVDLTPPVVPTVNAQLTNSATPTLSGTATLAAGETLNVTVNGVTYVAGDGNLVDNGDGTWTLAIPTGNELPQGVIDVSVTVKDAAGNSTSDAVTDELEIDLTPPVTPTVNAQLTNSATPTLSGTATLAAGETLSVTVNGVTYVAGDGNLVDNGDGTWTLVIPTGNELPQGAIDVSVTVTDAAGNSTSDTVNDDLEIDLTPPSTPTVNTQATNSATPTLSGTATLAVGETLSVMVNGVTYVAGDGNLVDNGDGTWTLVVPTDNALPEGVLNVSVIVTDAAGNSASNVSASDLEIDLTAPTTPTVNTQLTNSDLPTISGTATVAAGDTLHVTVNGITYVAGDGNLVDNGDGTWTLIIPTGNALPEGLNNVTVTVTDATGNSSSNSSTNQLTVDLTPPPVPGVTSQTTSDDTPLIQGTVTMGSGLTLSVEVNGIVYIEGDGNLVINTDGTWILAMPLSDALSDGSYQVIASLIDEAGNISTEMAIDELLVDTLVPLSPGVTSQTINTGTPVITGTAIVGNNETLTVNVGGMTYTAGDDSLVDNADGTWALTIPASNSLAEGNYNVSATVTDVALNTSTDPSSSELTIDLTAPVAPTATAQLSNSSTPTLNGTATVAAGETLSVTVNGITYVAGAGHLVDNGDGTWSLLLPTSDALSDGSYTVTVNIQDAAGNTSSAVDQSLRVDTEAPEVTATGPQEATTFRPILSGTAVVGNGSLVQVRDTQGDLICNAIVTDNLWSCIPLADFPEGETQLSANVADSANNVSTANFAISVSRDFDGDGLSNVLEGFGDSDGDGVSDSVDLDADNDGLPDSVEGTGDSDNDGLPDYLDEDADNDGIADLVEALGSDVDGDFLVDNFIDADGNGLSDSLQLTPLPKPDTDSDGIPDFLDVDSDQDGIPDLVETLGTDIDDNGRVDNFRDLDANGVDDAIQLVSGLLLDSDGDGIPDYRDLDSDNDGITDLIESGGVDIDNDGIIDTATDANGNGIPDSVDVFFTNGNDIDQDGIDDLADASITFGDDTDGDGILDDFDPDMDGDGRADTALFDLSLGAALPDTDLDGTPDFQQAGSGALRTGVTGRGGCSIGSGSASTSDPSLVLFVFLAMLGLIARSQRLRRQQPYQYEKFSDCKNAENARYAVVLLLLLTASTAYSDDLHRGPYLGAGIGQSLLEPDASDVSIKLQDSTDTALSILLGLDLTPRLAVELGYEDLGQAQLTNDVHVDYQIGHASVLVRGFNERENLIHRKGFSLFGKVGIGRMENSANFNFIREHDTSLIFGGGAEYGFSNGLALRADLTTFDTDAHRLGIFLLYRPKAGDAEKKKIPKTVVAKESVNQLPIVPAVEKGSATSVVVDSNSVVPEANHTSEFVILFDLNSSFTDFQGKVTAVNVAARMRHAPTLKVRLTGYTDTSGSDDYNRWLADRRIKQVSTLLQKRGVDLSRISTVVFGESSEFSSENQNETEHLNRRVQIELFNELP